MAKSAPFPIEILDSGRILKESVISIFQPISLRLHYCSCNSLKDGSLDRDFFNLNFVLEF